MAANGQISRLVTTRLLNENSFDDIHLTLFVRKASQVADLAEDVRVSIVEGSLDNLADVTSAISGQDIVVVGVVDHSQNNIQTKNVINAMKQTGVQRVVYANVLGIYDEVPGAFSEWNHATIGGGLPTAKGSDQLLANSDLDYTTLRLPWLNDRDVQYVITHRNDPYVGVSGSRKSIADVIIRIISNYDFLSKNSVGISDPETEGKARPVY